MGMRIEEGSLVFWHAPRRLTLWLTVAQGAPGANGLVAATAMAKSGMRVLVLEGEGVLGGTWSPVEFAAGMMGTLETEPDWIPPGVAMKPWP